MLNLITNRRQSPLACLFIVLITLIAFQFSAISQNIDATIGTGGIYTIKDATNPFLAIPQSSGNVNIYRNLILPTQTAGSAMGTIFKSTSSFIHTYQASSTVGQNIFIGIGSGNFTMSGSGISASYNTAVGTSSLNGLTSGYENSAFGVGSLLTNSTGHDNSAFGFYSLVLNNTGNSNSAFGVNSLRSNVAGYQNSAFGVGSLYTNDGANNSAFGYYSLYNNTSGGSNCAFGFWALRRNTDGASNSAFGVSSLDANTTGSANSAFGRNALDADSTGNWNSAFGYGALGSTTNSFNSAFGANAGIDLTTGTNVTCIGYDAQPNAPTSSNEIILGNGSITTLRCNTSTISALSDARDKKNIRDLNLGIDFLMKVKPRLFYWDRREWYENKTADGSKMEKAPTAGFIAQELDEVQTAEQAEWLKLVLKNNPDRLEATPGNLLPIIVKAIQEIKKEKDEQIAFLINKIAQYEQTQKLLVSRIEKLESTGSQIKEVKMSENK
jgi:hypothetical protein